MPRWRNMRHCTDQLERKNSRRRSACRRSSHGNEATARARLKRKPPAYIAAHARDIFLANGLCCRKHHLPQRQARIIDEERGVVADQAGQIRQWSFQPHCNYGHAAAVAIAARDRPQFWQTSIMRWAAETFGLPLNSAALAEAVTIVRIFRRMVARHFSRYLPVAPKTLTPRMVRGDRSGGRCFRI